MYRCPDILNNITSLLRWGLTCIKHVMLLRNEGGGGEGAGVEGGKNM